MSRPHLPLYPPTLFDSVWRSDRDVNPHTIGVDVATARARLSDPSTSHEAAATVKPGNGALIQAIRFAVEASDGPISAFDIAYSVSCGDEFRWSEATIRTAVSRAGLRAVDTEGRSPRGQRCIRYSL